MEKRWIEGIDCCITPIETFTLQMSVPLINETKFISVDLILYRDENNVLQYVFDDDVISSEPYLSNMCFDLENREDMDIVTKRIEKALSDGQQLSLMLSDINSKLKIVIDNLIHFIQEQVLKQVKSLFEDIYTCTNKKYIDYDYSYYNELPYTNSLGN